LNKFEAFSNLLGLMESMRKWRPDRKKAEGF
jgi:hypothetical protein